MKSIKLIALTAVLGAITETAEATHLGIRLTPIEEQETSHAPNDQMVGILSNALKASDPRIITTVPKGTKGKKMKFVMSNNAIREGYYYNTTRKAIDQYYTYMWKF